MPLGTCSESIPTVLPVSARLAQKAKQGEPSLWAASRFEALEQYLRDTLDAPEPLPSEAGQPARRRPGTRGPVRDDRRRSDCTLMGEDLQLLADIERQLAVYREDMERGFELRMAAVEKELADMEARGHRFFEDTLRIGRVDGPAQSRAGAEGVRREGRRRRADSDRAPRDRDDRLARRSGLPSVAGGHEQAVGASPAARVPDARRAGRRYASTTTAAG